MLCTEFVRIAGASVAHKHLRRQVVKVPGVPLSVQVMGTHVEHMAESAGAIAAAGADVVDINLGRPAPRVVKKGAGSAMLKNPALLFDVLSAMREQVPGLLSAKIRAGFDDASGVVAIAQTVERAGADFIAVHPRRRADFYEGVADWRIIATLKRELGIPVVGNGDVWYAADALRMREETGCDAVMIGRPACRNPWIFEQIADLEAGRTPHHPCGAELVDWFEAVAARYVVAFPAPEARPRGEAEGAGDVHRPRGRRRRGVPADGAARGLIGRGALGDPLHARGAPRRAPRPRRPRVDRPGALGLGGGLRSGWLRLRLLSVGRGGSEEDLWRLWKACRGSFRARPRKP